MIARGTDRSILLPAALGLALALGGCAHGMTGVDGVAGVAPSPAVAWTPPPTPPPPARAAATPKIPSALLAAKKQWTLGDLVDIALRNSTQTRQSWENARAAAAAYGSERGQWFPQVDLSANYTRQQSGGFAGRPQFQQRTYGANASLSFLIFNFGGRRASIEESRQALLAADWTHNAVIQNVILEVEQAYFQYQTAVALSASQQASVDEADTNLAAARARHDAGLATIADVLQAKTALAQARLALDQVQGQVQITRGALATAMGLPTTISFDVAVDEGPPPLEETGEAVDDYLARAEAARPDLAAARAQAEQAAAHYMSVKAEGFPQLTAGADAGRTYLDSPDQYQDTYSLSLQLNFPLFTGFSHHYDVRKAEAQALAAEARFESARQQVALQVWTSYYGLKTARQRLQSARDLMESATQNHDVAAGRYQSGVGSILDLLAAQSALESARASQVQARADWFLALAQLAHDTGALTTTHEAAPDSTAPGKENR